MESNSPRISAVLVGLGELGSKSLAAGPCTHTHNTHWAQSKQDREEERGTQRRYFLPLLSVGERKRSRKENQMKNSGYSQTSLSLSLSLSLSQNQWYLDEWSQGERDTHWQLGQWSCRSNNLKWDNEETMRSRIVERKRQRERETEGERDRGRERQRERETEGERRENKGERNRKRERAQMRDQLLSMRIRVLGSCCQWLL
jgi:hypothetical protein